MHAPPSFAGLLNAIATGARRGAELLAAWRDATPDPALARALAHAVILEREHAAAFAKRLSELGLPLHEPVREDFAAERAFALSDAPDHAKFRRLLGIPKPPGAADPLARLLDDPAIDPETGALLGRFIAEARDAERRLAAFCVPATEGPTAVASGTDDVLLHELVTRIDRIAVTLESLKRLRA